MRPSRRVHPEGPYSPALANLTFAEMLAVAKELESTRDLTTAASHITTTPDALAWLTRLVADVGVADAARALRWNASRGYLRWPYVDRYQSDPGEDVPLEFDPIVEVSRTAPTATATATAYAPTVTGGTGNPDEFTLFSGTPSLAANSTTLATVCGTEFYTTVHGTPITKVRYLQPTTGSTAQRTAAIYSTTNGTTGTLVAGPWQMPVPTPGQWCTLTLPTPVNLGANVRVRIAFLHPAGNFARTGGYFETGAGATDTVNGPLTMPSAANTLANRQGSYVYSSTMAFPSQVASAASYYSDVVGTEVPAQTPFTLGTTKPTADNTGAGVIRPYPTTVINGNVSLTGTQNLVDTIVNGRVSCSGSNHLIENCVINGGPTAPTSGQLWLVNTNSVTGNATIRFCDIAPTVASDRWNGIGTKRFTAERNKMLRNTDHFSVFSQASDGVTNVKILGNYCPNMTQFRPDVANNRAETHNDVVQVQGNRDLASDLLVEGNAFNARHSITAGTQPTTYKQLACIMLSPNTQPHCSGTFKNNWFEGGVYTFNAGGSTGGVVIITGNRFERPGYLSPGPTKALVLDPTITNRTISGNTYIDNGAAVPTSSG